jgi:hypothetical protein
MLSFVSPARRITRRQILQDSIRDLLSTAPCPSNAPPGSPRGVQPVRSSLSSGGGGSPTAAALSAAAAGSAWGSSGGGSRVLAYRDPDPTKDILIVGLEEVKVRLQGFCIPDRCSCNSSETGV